MASGGVWKTTNAGTTWTPVSPDLTRGVDRNQLEVRGRVWGVDTVAKNASTSFYGNVVSLSESPLVEGLFYAGTDDGLIQVTEDGGANWRKIESFPGISRFAYVSRIQASLHNPDTVYASFDIHKMGDFKPYILKSSDRGRSWSSISGDLPERGSVYAIVQDHEKKKLLFAGTEYGIFFTVDEGVSWHQLKGGIPVIAIRDLEIQRRENDLVAGSFGRGFFILDDFSPLRLVSDELISGEATLFPVRKAWMYIEEQDFDSRFQGNSYFTAKNPPFGAVFTYYLKEELKSLRKQRLEGIRYIEKALGLTSESDSRLRDRVRDLKGRLLDLQVRLSGDSTISKRNEPTLPSISDRVGRIVDSQWASTTAPTGTSRQAYQLASQLFEPVLDELRQLLETDLAEIDRRLEEIGAPWTPGRVPAWSLD